MSSPALFGLGLGLMVLGAVQVFALLGPVGRHGQNSGLLHSCMVALLFTIGMLFVVMGALG